MEFKVQHLQIKAGKYKVILNPEDAKEIGVRTGDRVQIKNHSYLTAIAEIGDLISKGSVGIYQDICDKLGKECPLTVNIVPTSRPRSVGFIKKIMDQQKLTQEEIHEIVLDIVRENLTEIELSAFVTSSYIHGMTNDEIEWMTRAMIDTGEKIEFDTHPIMDKHSIGGAPGNKISLPVVPIIAANGLLIPKTSSRAITGAGGTADLMEVLCPVEFISKEVKEITEKVGCALVW